MPDVYVVNANGLNLRSEPRVAPSTKLVTLPQGHRVRKLAEAADPSWWRVATSLGGADFVGFVKRDFLRAAEAGPVTPPPSGQLPPVHLHPTKPIRRAETTGRAYPLHETGQPMRSGVTADSLATIVDWLGVDTQSRYRAAAGATFCNIYAYDYCYLGNGYLPRVWWKASAIHRILNGENVAPLYDETVEELSANRLYNWLTEFGPGFGWQRVSGVGELQTAANDGRLAIICARRKDLNRSGHIVAVVPETDAHRALRAGGDVTVPLQSQAGAVNFRYGATKPWWTAEKFATFGFWAMR